MLGLEHKHVIVAIPRNTVKCSILILATNLGDTYKLAA